MLDFDRLHKHGSYTRRLYKDCTAGYLFLACAQLNEANQ